MTLLQKFLGAAATLALTAGAAAADPAIIFDLGGKFDKSFNEAAFAGAKRWADETGGTFKEVEMQSEAQREQAVRRFAESGANPVVMTGFAFGDVLNEVAPDYPDTKFAIIDMVVDQPNVQSVVFSEHEGSYLVGMMAAMASKTGTVGFVGGMDIPLIRKFACGYAQGVKAANPDAKIVANMTGTTPAAWNDPVKGSELTRAQISQGADVVYAAAGGTGVGVLQTAADEGILSIGVDFEPELHASGLGPDLDDEARRQRRLRGLQGRRDRRVQDRRAGHGPEGRGRGLCDGRQQRLARHRRDEGEGRGGEGQDRLGRDRGA